MAHQNEWLGHVDWWLNEVRTDPIYEIDVLPLLRRLVGSPAGPILDMGCGDGQALDQIAGRVIGCDVSIGLLRHVRVAGPLVQCELPNLDWLQPGSIEAAYMVLVLEHLPDLRIFEYAARAVATGGSMTIVMNHPTFTADGSGPIMDPSDGEVLWRWGRYFHPAASRMATPDADVTFYHRPLYDIVNAAADAGWKLDEMVETGFSEAAVATEPGYVGQEEIPRLLGVRWMNTQGGRR